MSSAIPKRSYIIPLRKKYRNTQRPQRAKKAVSVLRDFLSQHMKSDEVKIGAALNELVWAQGIKNPPSKVSVVTERNEDGVVYADLEGQLLPSEKEAAKEEAASDKAVAKEKPVVKEEAASEETPVPKKSEVSSEETKESSTADEKTAKSVSEKKKATKESASSPKKATKK